MPPTHHICSTNIETAKKMSAKPSSRWINMILSPFPLRGTPFHRATAILLLQAVAPAGQLRMEQRSPPLL